MLPMTNLCGTVATGKEDPLRTDIPHLYAHFDMDPVLGRDDAKVPNKETTIPSLQLQFNVTNYPSKWNIRVPKLFVMAPIYKLLPVVLNIITLILAISHPSTFPTGSTWPTPAWTPASLGTQRPVPSSTASRLWELGLPREAGWATGWSVMTTSSSTGRRRVCAARGRAGSWSCPPRVRWGSPSGLIAATYQRLMSVTE